MRVINELRERPTDMPLAIGTAPIPALRFDRAHDAVGGGPCIRRLTWRLYDANSSLTERRPNGLAPLGIPIADQHPASPRGGRRAGPRDLRQNASSGCGVEPRIGTRREASSITQTV